MDIFPYDFLNDYNDMETLNELYYQTRTRYHRNISKKLDLDECVNQYYKDLNLSFEKSKSPNKYLLAFVSINLYITTNS